MSSNSTMTPLDQALHEPVKDVFHTQHSTPVNRDIARNGLILLTEVGSTMHGVTHPTSGDDVDEMGICIEPPTYITGLAHFEQYEYRTQPVNHRSGPGDIDRTVYGLRKWARLAAAGNPTVLMPLFADLGEHVRYMVGCGDSLRANADLFLSKQTGHRFLGYLEQQRKRYLDPERVDSTHASRPELIEQFGWDTKTGYHALRLAVQGIQLMDTGIIELPMNSTHREWLLGVRNGEMTKEQATHALDEFWIPRLKTAIEQSVLPEYPDYEKINSWLTSTYQQYWTEKGWI